MKNKKNLLINEVVDDLKSSKSSSIYIKAKNNKNYILYLKVNPLYVVEAHDILCDNNFVISKCERKEFLEKLDEYKLKSDYNIFNVQTLQGIKSFVRFIEK